MNICKEGETRGGEQREAGSRVHVYLKTSGNDDGGGMEQTVEAANQGEALMCSIISFVDGSGALRCCVYGISL